MQKEKNSSEKKFPIVIKTHFGLEHVLADEAEDLGAQNVEILTRAIRFHGDVAMLYRANLHLRTALRVLKPIFSFRAKNEKSFYNGMREINWSEFLDVNGTLAIDSAVNSDFFSNSRYISMLAKDAVVDQFREKFSSRPSVDLADPSLRINVQIAGDECNISLDSSGDSLHKRGYRSDVDVAPLNEVLAAGMIALTGWNGESNFVDPMCGSGTLVIEAAMRALNVPAGYYREKFGFENWPDFDKNLWKKILDEAHENIREDFSHEIAGSDISGRVAEIARENISFAKLDDIVKISSKRMEHFAPPNGPGVVVMNPPYGERLDKADAQKMYTMIGDEFKKKYSGYECWLLTSNLAALKSVGLRPSKKITLYNGPLECRFVNYSMYAGTRKTKFSEKNFSEKENFSQEN